MNDKRQHKTRKMSIAVRRKAEAARQATLRELGADNALEVFVVRSSPSDPTFSWEIRRFGAIAVKRSDHAYASEAAARGAGMDALTRHVAGARLLKVQSASP